MKRTIFLAMLMLTGCGGVSRYPTKGIVMIDNKPLTTGTIMVVPKDGRPATGTINADGSFSLTSVRLDDGVMAGTHEVAIISNKPYPNGDIEWLIPKKYSKSGESGVTLDVKGANDEVRIDLTWAGGKPFVEKNPKVQDGSKERPLTLEEEGLTSLVKPNP